MPNVMKNVADILRRNARNYPKKTGVIIEDGRTCTFKELDQRTSKVANSLIGMGIKKGDRIAMLHHNDLPYYEIPFICGKAGFVEVNVNERLAPKDITYILNDSGAKVIITTKNFIPVIEQIKPETSLEVVIVTDAPASEGYLSYNDLIEKGAPEDPAVVTEDSDGCLLLYTSGTTGKPKGAYLSQKAVVACCTNYLTDLLTDPTAIYIAEMPYYHSVCISHMAWSMRGCTLVIARFEPESFMALVDRYKVTDAFLVPTMIRMILEHPKFDQYDLSTLKTCMYAASPMPEALLRKALEKFGPIFVHMYGMAENGNLATCLRKYEHVLDGPPEVTRRLLSCGREITLARVRVVNEMGEDVAPDVPGEIIVNDESLFNGYWNKPEATAEVYRDGWFYTGDIGLVDEDGYIYIIDRKNDLIISGGSNIYPREIEEVLFAHPAIQDVCVVGVPHDVWVEAVKAVIVRKPGESLTEEEVLNYCRKNMSSYRVPKSVDFVESLPRDANGKIQKRVVRAKYWEGRGSAIV